MSTYNITIGGYLIAENVPGQEVKDKLEHIKAFFNYYPDDELRKEEIAVIKNENKEDWITKLRSSRYNSG